LIAIQRIAAPVNLIAFVLLAIILPFQTIILSIHLQTVVIAPAQLDIF
jgi:hypothetical protein